LVEIDSDSFSADAKFITPFQFSFLQHQQLGSRLFLLDAQQLRQVEA